MNLGWYEVIDRISVIQNTINDRLYEHQVADLQLQQLLDDVQHSLNQAYQYAREMFNDSCEGGEIK